jgi:hypothetical protein
MFISLYSGGEGRDVQKTVKGEEGGGGRREAGGGQAQAIGVKFWEHVLRKNLE